MNIKGLIMSEKIYFVAGARPNFMKIAPLIHECKRQGITYKLIHTGQHYDYNMSKIFFDNLGIPEPDVHLNVGSASHAVQTARIMMEFEKVLLEEAPDWVTVVGDVNSTIACALVAKKLFIRVAHVEAGLRSFDERMPEEINRVLTDRISDVLFTTEQSGMDNLLNEGVAPEKIHFVGNIMIDTLAMNLEKAKRLGFFKQQGLQEGNYALSTFHRPSNVDSKVNLEKILRIIEYASEHTPVYIPLHPRTEKNLKTFGLMDRLEGNARVLLSEAVGYHEFLNLMAHCRFILTDSGGIQEEASFLKKPVLTMRSNTERPITIDQGTNTLIGNDLQKAKLYIDQILEGEYKHGKEIEKWDGTTAARIIKVLKRI